VEPSEPVRGEDRELDDGVFAPAGSGGRHLGVEDCEGLGWI
jgi:hypothetical protein